MKESLCAEAGSRGDEKFSGKALLWRLRVTKCHSQAASLLTPRLLCAYVTDFILGLNECCLYGRSRTDWR